MINFKNIPKEEKPRERLLLYGPKKLSNEELLMIILKSGTKKKSVKELAMDVLSICKDIRNIKNLTIQELLKIDGIGTVKAIEICGMVELFKRVYTAVDEKELVTLNNPNTIINYFYDLFIDKKQEEFYCVYLDQKKKYIGKKKLFIGTINSSIVHPREIFKEAYLLSASFIICIHNHPSGDSTPSKEDIILTKKIKELGELHCIYLVDHIIIGNNNYYSFYNNKTILNTNS